MKTPICDFIADYNARHVTRLHMPGHKGVSFLGCEALDLTEVSGADALYEADGIIAESEANAASLFGSRRTVYSAEGSSQCIRGMLCLALTCRAEGAAPVIVAARNVHKAFVYAAALLDFQVVWLWPEGEHSSICGCPISARQLEDTLASLPQPPAAVYLTSPDYLGGMADLRQASEICHRYHTILAVDNAHGAYLRFLEPSLHPLDLGADLCCDSAHKTLPVLTGGAYLHISKTAPAGFAEHAKSAMALFGSTSPSYLILQSLDRCNRYLAENYRKKLAHTAGQMEQCRQALRANGWKVRPSDPLRITVESASGTGLADLLRANGMECEYADPESLVLMLTPENRPEDLDRIVSVLGENPDPDWKAPALPLAKSTPRCSIREAMFAPHRLIPVSQALGRICAAPTVGCPPAIPIAVSGEEIGPEALQLFEHYGIETVDVLI